MTPAERAESLVDKFDNAIGHTSNDDQEKETAKVCALICVEEIIESGPFHSNVDESYKETYNDYLDAAKEYWVKVKEQIKLL